MEFPTDPAEKELLITDFIELYNRRPIVQNVGGMRFNHSFAVWYILKSLKPVTVIESGVWQGHSTWLIEQACPSAKLFCLDLDFSRLIYKSPTATYIQDDFSRCAWGNVQRETALCFFDDHQNAYERVKTLSWAGFRRAIFEDNWPCGEGDCYSLRHMQAGFGHPHLQMSAKYRGNAQQQRQIEVMENALRSIGPNQKLLVNPNTVDRELFRNNCKTYAEFPPVALTETSLLWDKRYVEAYTTKPPLFSAGALPAALQNIMNSDPREFDYSYIAYIELN
jgi:hypothetical protein